MKPLWPDFELILDQTGYFSGVVHRSRFAAPKAEPFSEAVYVHFAAGARTNWHTHQGEQILIGVKGECVLVYPGKPPQRFGMGQSVRIPAGERHWHGATEVDSAHIAVNLGATDWLEAVTEAEYREGQR